MSIALDLALFLRNSETKLGLSLTTIGVAYTLAFRIGSNSNTWVSQETLAQELGIAERNVRIHCKYLNDAKILQTAPSKKDKRKNVYNFTSAVMNYHAMSDSQKEKCHKKLGDSFINTGRNHPVNNLDTGRNHPVFTGRNHPLLSSEENPAALQPQGPQDTPQSPKGKEENNKKSKDKIEQACAPKKTSKSFKSTVSENYTETESHALYAKEHGLDITLERQNFIDWYLARGTLNKNWDRCFSLWLRRSAEWKKGRNNFAPQKMENPFTKVKNEILQGCLL